MGNHYYHYPHFYFFAIEYGFVLFWFQNLYAIDTYSSVTRRDHTCKLETRDTSKDAGAQGTKHCIVII